MVNMIKIILAYFFLFCGCGKFAKVILSYCQTCEQMPILLRANSWKVKIKIVKIKRYHMVVLKLIKWYLVKANEFLSATWMAIYAYIPQYIPSSTSIQKANPIYTFCPLGCDLNKSHQTNMKSDLLTIDFLVTKETHFC